MSTSISIIKRFVELGYLPAGTHRKSSSRKNPMRVIQTAMRNASCNLFIGNVPTSSAPRNCLRLEEITHRHIFETLLEYGSPHYVIQISPSCYMAYATDADSIADQLIGNTIGGRALDVQYFRLADPLEVRSVEVEDNESSAVEVVGTTMVSGVLAFFFWWLFMVVYNKE